MNTHASTLPETNMLFAVGTQTAIANVESVPGQTRISKSRPKENVCLSKEEQAMVQAIRAGEEQAFMALVEQYHGGLLRLAKSFVSSESVAEEVVQDTWLGVLEGIHRFEGRSSLKTWIYRILTNRAKTKAVRESRYVPIIAGDSTRFADDANSCGIEVDQLGSDELPEPLFAKQPSPEQQLQSKELFQYLEEVLKTLPGIHRQVLIMRDVEEFSSEEVAEMFHLTQTNQRVILHRARCRVRQALAHVVGN